MLDVDLEAGFIKHVVRRADACVSARSSKIAPAGE
jgi:hypothetical protein